ncbi:MAG: CoA transferase, partial [Chloroflexota bacterium]
MTPLPLHNIRVLDLAHLLPGEFATMYLAALGAEVIKIESTQAESFADEGLLIHELVNRGKRSIALDLKTESGQRTLHKLAATADVLVEGFRPGVTARLNADYQTLRAINP